MKDDQSKPETTPPWLYAVAGKSVSAAAIMILAIKLKPMSAAAIASLLEAGGFPFTSDDHTASVTIALRRERSKSGFVRTVRKRRYPTGEWILAHWLIPSGTTDYCYTPGPMEIVQ